jgi:deoxyxylulose-5-phosphate synthase
MVHHNDYTIFTGGEEFSTGGELSTGEDQEAVSFLSDVFLGTTTYNFRQMAEFLAEHDVDASVVDLNIIKKWKPEQLKKLQRLMEVDITASSDDSIPFPSFDSEFKIFQCAQVGQ